MPTPRATTANAVPTPTAVPPTEPREAREKSIIPIYFTLVTDGPLPGAHNLLHVQARFSPEVTFEQNITPQHTLRSGSGLGEELVRKLAVGAVPVATAMKDLDTWLQKFHGARLPVSSALAFWHLVYHMNAYTTKIPFLSNPIDVNSFFAGASGDLTKSRLVRGKDPWKAMAQREAIVKEAVETAGELKW